MGMRYRTVDRRGPPSAHTSKESARFGPTPADAIFQIGGWNDEARGGGVTERG